MRLKEGDRESVSDWCSLGTEHFHLEKFWLWWEIITVLIKKEGEIQLSPLTGKCLTFGLMGVLLNLSFNEWDRCHFLLLTPHSLERAPATQIAKKLSPYTLVRDNKGKSAKYEATHENKGTFCSPFQAIFLSILNTLTHFFTHSFIHTYTKSIQTILLKLFYHTLPK